MLGHFSGKYDPWRILIGTILSARARDEVTEQVCEVLFNKYPTVEALAGAKQQDIEQCIQRIGFYHTKARNIIKTSKIVIQQHHGSVPGTMDDLLTLPGVGRKVAGCVLVYAFQKDAIPVDTHVHRISNRLGWVRTKAPEQTEQRLMKIVPKKNWQVVNDCLVSHGKKICKPIQPLCHSCCIERYCKKVGIHKKKINWQKNKK
ncbi:endonuclease III [Candidatus Woesearchaeota archaeon]|nr:endonuclease III [Candidatus Woesearchaeota archaeon]